LEDLLKTHLTLGVVLTLALIPIFGKNSTEAQPKLHASSDVFLSAPLHTFEVHGTALYMQPTGSNLNYAAEAVPFPVLSPDWKIHEIESEYHFGFDVGFMGVFHCTNTTLSLNWEHFHSSDSSSKTVASTNMIGPFFEIGPDATPYKKAKGRATFHFDEVNLDYGLSIHFGDRLKSHLYGGVSFVRIEQTRSSHFSNLSGTIHRTIHIPSTFTGTGPQIGTDFAYRIVKGFNLTGQAAISLFVGTQKNHTDYKTSSPTLAAAGGPLPNHQKTQVHKKTQVVPGLEGSLGLSYVFTFCKEKMLKLEAGYKAQVYINAIQSIDMGSEVVTPPLVLSTTGVYARTFEQSLSNFALAGPYLTLDLGF
jgi:hypothetical protein